MGITSMWEGGWGKTGISPITEEIMGILKADMTRDRTLKQIEEIHPSMGLSFKWFLKKAIDTWKTSEKKAQAIELWSGEWLLADNIQKHYPLIVNRIDIYKPSTQESLPPWWIIRGSMDINKFDKFPTGIEILYSFFTLQYIAKAPDILSQIYKKLKPWGIAYIQFPYFTRDIKLVKQLAKINKGKGIIIRYETTKDNYVENLVFILEKKEGQELIIPTYQSKKWKIPTIEDGKELTLRDGEKIPNIDLFYHYELREENQQQIDQSAHTQHPEPPDHSDGNSPTHNQPHSDDYQG